MGVSRHEFEGCFLSSEFYHLVLAHCWWASHCFQFPWIKAPPVEPTWDTLWRTVLKNTLEFSLLKTTLLRCNRHTKICRHLLHAIWWIWRWVHTHENTSARLQCLFFHNHRMWRHLKTYPSKAQASAFINLPFTSLGSLVNAWRRPGITPHSFPIWVALTEKENPLCCVNVRQFEISKWCLQTKKMANRSLPCPLHGRERLSVGFVSLNQNASTWGHPEKSFMTPEDNFYQDRGN